MTVTWPADVSMHLWAARDNSAVGVTVDTLGIQRLVRMKFRS